MTLIRPHKTKNNVTYLTKEENGFSSQYLDVRHKEGRVLSDEEVFILPEVLKNNINGREWLLRKKASKRFVDYLNTRPNNSILDVGCGNGWFSNLITINNNSVVGIDINVTELEQAARVFKKENLQFVYGDIFKIDEVFKNKFDIIVLNASIQYFENFNALITKLKTFLNPKGEIHIIDSPFYNDRELSNAKKRTEDYYGQLGFPEMAKYYFHHSIENLKDFKIMYSPKNDFRNKFFGAKDSPFLWTCLSIKTTGSAIKKGFSDIAYDYEALDKTSGLIHWMRNRIRKHFIGTLDTNSSILEINCGSGIDAVFFAKKGYKVHATDIAEGMIGYVRSKIISENLDNYLTCGVLSFEELHSLKEKRYSHIFSNFGGLNCSSPEELEKAFNSFKEVLEPYGCITLVIMPRICLWEFLKIFKGDATAFRRLKKKGILANIKGEKVLTYYHSTKRIKDLLKEDFTDFKIENICFLGPTGNHIHFYEKYPFLFKILSSFDTLTNKIPFLRGYGDYYIISAKRKK